MRPQKYVRNSGLRPHDFHNELEGVPSGVEIWACVLLAALVSFVVSLYVGV